MNTSAEKVKQVTLEEIDRSIATSRFWGKDEVYSYLTELKQRIEYRLRASSSTPPETASYR